MKVRGLRLRTPFYLLITRLILKHGIQKTYYSKTCLHCTLVVQIKVCNVDRCAMYRGAYKKSNEPRKIDLWRFFTLLFNINF